MIVNHKILNIRNIETWPLEEVKNYLRITSDYDDVLLIGLVETATNIAESFTGLSLHNRHILCEIKNAKPIIKLKHVPVLRLTGVRLASKDEKEDISDDFGFVETSNSTLHLASHYAGKDVEIEYESGYEEHIPREIQHGILMHVASMYEHSEDGTSINSEIKDLYLPYRVMKI